MFQVLGQSYLKKYVQKDLKKCVQKLKEHVSSVFMLGQSQLKKCVKEKLEKVCTKFF